MVNIAVDYGNSSTKVGVFKNSELLITTILEKADRFQIEKFINKYSPDGIILSSVIGNDEFDWIDKCAKKTIKLNHHTALPFINQYKSPKTIGKDRVGAVAGAQSLFENENILVIDAGTAITFDFLSSDHHYLGGNIAPGLEMRFKALNKFTHQLPLVDKGEFGEFPGQNTREAISAGVINGMIFEIEGYIRICTEKWGDIQTIITGGDSDFFVKKLKKPIFVNQNLVLLGLNRILEHNV